MSRTLSRKDRILNGDKVAFPTASEQILMKHVAEGGSGGGLQLEKIGETKTIPWFNEMGQIMLEYYKLGDNIGIVRGGGGGMPYTAPSDTMEITIDTTPFRRIGDVNMASMLLPVIFTNNNKPLRTTGLMVIKQVSGEMSLIGLPTEPFNAFEVCGMIPAKTVNT